MALRELLDIMHVVTGLSRSELLEAATSPEKQQDAMLKVSQNAAEKAGRMDLAARIEKARHRTTAPNVKR